MKFLPSTPLSFARKRNRRRGSSSAPSATSSPTAPREVDQSRTFESASRRRMWRESWCSPLPLRAACKLSRSSDASPLPPRGTRRISAAPRVVERARGVCTVVHCRQSFGGAATSLFEAAPGGGDIPSFLPTAASPPPSLSADKVSIRMVWSPHMERSSFETTSPSDPSLLAILRRRA